MNGSCRPETSTDIFERRYETAREWTVHALSFTTAVLIASHYSQDGVVMTVLVFIGVYAIAHYVGDVIWLTSVTWLLLLTMLIFICTVFYAFSHFSLLPALLMALFLPGIAQAYMIWDLWPATSSLLHPLPLLCLAWLALLGIWAFEPRTFRWLKSAWRRCRQHC